MRIRLFILLTTFLLSLPLMAQRYGGPTPILNASARYSSNLPLGSIFYEGFENAQRPGLPQGWISQSNANVGYITSTGGDAAGQTNENGFWPVPLHGIFAVSNDDVCNCDKSQDKLISPFIDASSLDQLFLRFETFQNGSGGQLAFVEIKAQGLPWLKVFDIPASSNWESYELRIPSHYLKRGFQFRFHFSDEGNYAAGLAIDDILLTVTSKEALGISSAQWVPGLKGEGTGQLQQKIPLKQARAARWNPEVHVQNEGLLVKNAVIESMILGPSNQVLSATEWRTSGGSITNINSSTNEVLTPFLTGSYIAEIDVSTDSTDEVSNDNQKAYTFEVSDSSYRWVAPTSNYNLGAWVQSTGDRIGSGFHFNAGDSLNAIMVNIHPASEAGARFRFKIFSYDTLTSSVYSSSPFELDATDIGRVIRLPIGTRISRGRKLMVIEKESGDERLVLALSPNTPSRERNTLTKKALGNWQSSPYFPQIELITAASNTPCEAFILKTIAPPSCAGLDDGSIALNVQGNAGNISYNWSNGAVNVSQISGLDSGQYTVTITDADGCTYEDHFTIQQPDTLVGLVNLIADSCGTSEGRIQLNMSGGRAPYTAVWNGDTLGLTRQGLTRGSYPVQVIDVNGCIWSDTVILPGSADLGVIFTRTEPSCGDSNGVINTTVIGTSPFQYSWNTGTSGTNLTGISAGIYTLTLTDSIGCSIEHKVAIKDQNAPSISIGSIDNVTCSGESTGAISLVIGGGSLPYAYQWSNGANTKDLDSLSVGSYILSLTDQQNCKAFEIFEITTDAQSILVDFNDRGNYCWKDSTAIVEALVSGGKAPYEFNWSNGVDEAIIDGLGAGTYQLTVTDLNGCSRISSIDVAEGPPFFIQLDSLQEDTSTSVLINGSISVSTYGGTPPHTHFWNDSIGEEDLPNVPNGVYNLIARDQLGCTEFFSVELGKGPVAVKALKHTAEEMRIFPNPLKASQACNINGSVKIVAYQWLDVNGRVLSEGSTQTNNRLKAPKYAGPAILVIKTADGSLYKHRMVIIP